MDNVTHALAGLLLGEATVVLAGRRAPVSSGFRRTALVLGVLCAELPDIDLLYAGPALGMGKLGYMLHHRGHTHTVVFAIVGALVAWGVALAVARGIRDRRERAWLLALAATCTLVAHIALDWTNSYGVHPWWPVSNAWHYGDSVFIVEPWLWVIAIPPLLFLERSRIVRALLALALLGIVALAWRVGMVERGAALAVTLGAAAMLAVAWAVRTRGARALVAIALVAWLVVEATFMTTAYLARAAVRDVVPPASYVDAAITPQVGNPLCHDALVVEHDGPTYSATRATVAALPSLRSIASCARRVDASRTRATTAAVQWGESWSAPVAELQQLARERCEVAAALRFIRVPAWERLADGGVRVWDLRYNRGGGGFAELVVPARSSGCDWPIPPWTPPREALLVDEVE